VMDAVIEMCYAFLCRGMFQLCEYSYLIRMLCDIIDTRDDTGSTTPRTRTSRRPGRDTTSDQDVEDRVIEILKKVMTMLDTIFSFLIARNALGVIDHFCHAGKVGRLSQMFNLDPETFDTFGHEAAKYHSGDTPDVMDRFVLSRKPVKFDLMTRVFAAVMDAGQQRNSALRLEAVKLFSRLTNYPGELLRVVKTIQVLTTRSAAEYYREAKRSADSLRTVKSSLLSPEKIELAESALTALDTQLASRGGGMLADKLVMLRHLQVPNSILGILHMILAPPRPEFVSFILHSVQTLTLLAQDDSVAEYLVENTSMFLHLVTHNVDVLSLIRRLYVSPTFGPGIEIGVLREIVAALGQPHSGCETTLFLQDLIQAKDSHGHYVNRVQDGLWRCLVSNYYAQDKVRFKLHWTGRRGREVRNKTIANPSEFYSCTGRLQLHLEVATLVFYIAKNNLFTRKEEIRQEMFGNNAVDDILEVVSNLELPLFYRARFINLLQSLILEDKECRSQLFAHRAFPTFIATCRSDIRNFRRKIGDDADDALFGSPKLPAPQDEIDAQLAEERENVDAYVDFFCLCIAPALKYICKHFDEVSSTRTTDKAVSMIVENINDTVDETCEFIRYAFRVNDYRVVLPSLRTKPKHRAKLTAFLQAARAASLCGTDAWSADIDTIIGFVPAGEDSEMAAVRRKAAELQDNVDERSIGSRWHTYYSENIAPADSLQPDNMYISAAGVILRASHLGTRFLRYASASMHDLREDQLIALLGIIRQTVAHETGSSVDDSMFLTIVFSSSRIRRCLLTLFSQPSAQWRSARTSFPCGVATRTASLDATRCSPRS